MNLTFQLAGIGEILWDVFPIGLSIGGAPANFAYHCHQLDLVAFVCTQEGATPEIPQDFKAQVQPLSLTK